MPLILEIDISVLIEYNSDCASGITIEFQPIE